MRAIVRSAQALAAVAVVGAAWFFLAPPQLGGGTSYAVVYGSSMEPHLHRGDLVVLRRGGDYRAGHVVGYHSRELGREVLHRIVAVRGDRFVFKGDNNGFLDPERPLASQLFGGEWFVLPRLGAIIERLRSPRDAALAAGAAVFLLGLGGGARARRRRRTQPIRQPQPEAAESPAAAPEPPRPGPSGRTMAARMAIGLVLVATCTVAFGSLLAIAALTRPAQRTFVEPNLYVQRGTFSYTATAPVGAVYQTRTLGPSDPIFLRLVRRLTVRFAYRVHSRYPSQFDGSARLDAVLGDGNGWRRRLVVAEERPLRGEDVVIAGPLDLERLTEAVRRFEALTGLHNTAYRVGLVPRVRLHGTVEGRPVRANFAPALALDLDGLRLQIARPADGAPPNGLVRAKSTPASRSERLALGAFGLRVPVARARLLALAIAGGGLVVGLVGGLLLLLGRRGDEVGAIERRYGDMIVPIAAGGRPAGVERQVTTIDALARLAERYERLILHEQRNGQHSFLVEEGGLVYRYDAGLEPASTNGHQATKPIYWPAHNVEDAQR
jgi:signal peptidase I